MNQGRKVTDLANLFNCKMAELHIFKDKDKENEKIFISGMFAC